MTMALFRRTADGGATADLIALTSRVKDAL
jgi:hypothetical protein